MPSHLRTAYDRCRTAQAELSGQEETRWLTELGLFTVWPFAEFANPGLNY